MGKNGIGDSWWLTFMHRYQKINKFQLLLIGAWNFIVKQTKLLNYVIWLKLGRFFLYLNLHKIDRQAQAFFFPIWDISFSCISKITSKIMVVEICKFWSHENIKPPPPLPSDNTQQQKNKKNKNDRAIKVLFKIINTQGFYDYEAPFSHFYNFFKSNLQRHFPLRQMIS